MSASQRRLIAGVAIVGLGLFTLLGVLDVLDAAGQLRRHQDDLEDVTQKLREIQALSSAPKVAALEVESPEQILTRINEAVEKVGVANLLANQSPMEPIRVKNSDFAVRKIDIKLNAASIKQIMLFCEALRDESTGSLVRDLNLYEPKMMGGRETWRSQMVLTQIIFSPKSDS